MIAKEEGALIIFTVLLQAAVGASAMLAVTQQLNGQQVPDVAFTQAMAALLIVALIALLASFRHLGRPLRALNSLRNIKSSWLSREIFFSGGFFTMLALAVATSGMGMAHNLVSWLTVAAGVLAVVSMASVYHMTVESAWHGMGTYIPFVGTTLRLGAISAGGLLVLFGSDSSAVAHVIRVLGWIALIALALEMAIYPTYVASLKIGGKAAQESLTFLAGRNRIAVALRWLLSIIGGLVFLVGAGTDVLANTGMVGLVSLGWIFVFAGEMLGRDLFYAMRVGESPDLRRGSGYL